MKKRGRDIIRLDQKQEESDTIQQL